MKSDPWNPGKRAFSFFARSWFLFRVAYEPHCGPSITDCLGNILTACLLGTKQGQDVCRLEQSHPPAAGRQLVGNKHVFRSLTWISRDSGWPHSLFLPNFLQKMGNRWCDELVAGAFQTLPNRLWQAWWATWPPTWECSTPPRPNRPLSKLSRSRKRSNFSHLALLLFRRSIGAWKSFAMDSAYLLKTT